VCVTGGVVKEKRGRGEQREQRELCLCWYAPASSPWSIREAEDGWTPEKKSAANSFFSSHFIDFCRKNSSRGAREVYIYKREGRAGMKSPPPRLVQKIFNQSLSEIQTCHLTRPFSLSYESPAFLRPERIPNHKVGCEEKENKLELNGRRRACRPLTFDQRQTTNPCLKHSARLDSFMALSDSRGRTNPSKRDSLNPKKELCYNKGK